MSVQTPATPAPSGRKRRRGVVAPYDFRRPTTLAREHSRALDMAFETFARQWSTSLLSRLRQPSTVTAHGVSALTYDEYIRSLPGTGILFTFRPDADAAAGLLQLTGSTAMRGLDFLLGGRGTTEASEAERELTEIERRLLTDLVARSLEDLAYAFATTAPMDPVLGKIETSPQFLQLATAADLVLVAAFSIALGEDAEAEEATLMLPMAAFLARLADTGADEARSADEARARAEAAEVLSRSVPELPVDVAARMSPVVMRPREVVSLSVGDVVRLPHPTTRPLDVVTNDVVLARAVAGTSGKRLACLVVGTEEESTR